MPYELRRPRKFSCTVLEYNASNSKERRILTRFLVIKRLSASELQILKL